jgi:hypothetical protein
LVRGEKIGFWVIYWFYLVGIYSFLMEPKIKVVCGSEAEREKAFGLII